MITVTLPTLTDRQARGYAALVEGRDPSDAIAALVVAESQARGARLEAEEREALTALFMSQSMQFSRDIVSLIQKAATADEATLGILANLVADATAAVDAGAASLPDGIADAGAEAE